MFYWHICRWTDGFYFINTEFSEVWYWWIWKITCPAWVDSVTPRVADTDMLSMFLTFRDVYCTRSLCHQCCTIQLKYNFTCTVQAEPQPSGMEKSQLVGVDTDNDEHRRSSTNYFVANHKWYQSLVCASQLLIIKSVIITTVVLDSHYLSDDDEWIIRNR